ncbi:hypothetical protein CHCC20488_4092 [Bacillus paralicheniformis]|nr:hypothetical protein CHCC20497_2615 [Bacillus paralicheniformis]TWN42687.1 hypothetical protein CHCC14523_0783 [Bacillus paralicheniformis]TWN85720.1 hypothetical protein CHCC20492_0979 [Bacillus paralicheniformis]TWO08081.1 hypothetical protein CHCC20488_4092 [Bacillus paralicheniformis]
MRKQNTKISDDMFVEYHYNVKIEEGRISWYWRAALKLYMKRMLERL